MMALQGCGVARLDCAKPDPLVIARIIDAKAQMRAMLKAIVPRTETAAMVAAKRPADFASKLQTAIDQVVDRHGAEWEANLAQSYRQNSGAAEIVQACKAINQGDRDGFMAFANRVAVPMQAKSTPLLQKSAVEVLALLSEK
jgi:hypothetical protein